MTATDGQIFQAVADALVAIDTPDHLKRQILACTMDSVGVPMTLILRYRNDPVIVELFGSRGVRLVDDVSTNRIGDDGTALAAQTKAPPS